MVGESNSGQRAFIVRSLFALTVGALMMGNESCNQAEQKRERALKMDVYVGAISAAPVTLPSGEVIDFPRVANELFYREVMNNGHFVISNPIPTQATVRTASVGSPGFTLGDGGQSYSMEDYAVLDSYGFFAPKNEASTLNAAQAAAPACVYDSPQTALSGSVISFELEGAGGIRIGFGKDGLITTPVSGNVAVGLKRSKLEIGLRADNPLTGRLDSIADARPYQTEVNFALDLTQLFGLDFFYKTPLSDVVRKAFQQALGDIVDTYKNQYSAKGSWADVWKSHVILDPNISNGDTLVAFRGGLRADVKKGDRFQIYGMYYKWKGTPCASLLDYSVELPAEPIALVEAISVGPDVTVATVLNASADYRIRPGAKVTVESLKQEESAQTKSLSQR